MREPAATDSLTRRNLFFLGLSLLIGAVAIYLLRRPWAPQEFWPWLVLLVSMFLGAYALKGLQLWLPGQPIYPLLAVSPKTRFRLLGVIYIIAAFALTTWIVLHLWPDYANWSGMPLLWVTAIVLILIGAFSIGAANRTGPLPAPGRWAPG